MSIINFSPNIEQNNLNRKLTAYTVEIFTCMQNDHLQLHTFDLILMSCELNLGDTTIGYMEVTDKEPYLIEGIRHSGEQTKGACLVPKRALNVMQGEVNRILQLTSNSVIPITYQVPRKTYRYSMFFLLKINYFSGNFTFRYNLIWGINLLETRVDHFCRNLHCYCGFPFNINRYFKFYWHSLKILLHMQMKIFQFQVLLIYVFIMNPFYLGFLRISIIRHVFEQ